MTGWKLALTKWIPDKIYLQMMFFRHFGRLIDFRNPKTFNEKLQWLKLYDRNPEYTRMVDKLEAKEYVAEKIGKEYIIPTLGVWDTPEQIDFDSLPDQFVLKWNHDSGSVVICRNKETFDRAAAIQKLQRGKKYSGYWYGREWPYKNVKPKVFAEAYLSDKLKDYKLFCFQGIPKVTLVCSDRFSPTGLREDFYDEDWNHLNLKRPSINWADIPNACPLHYDFMKESAKILSNTMSFVRMDFYEWEEEVFFGEVTLYPAAGFWGFCPKEYDLILGDWLVLPTVKIKK